MSKSHSPGRRHILLTLAGLGAGASLPAWAQGPAKGITSTRLPTVVQIADVSQAQIDVSKDFVVGSRAAWQDINAKGGVRGIKVAHKVIEVDGSAASLGSAMETIKTQAQVLALFGTVGDRIASQASYLLRRELPEMPHIAPWLQNTSLAAIDSTFPIFASRQEQLAHAIKSLSVMGVAEVGAIYATPSDFANYRDDVEQMAAAMKLRMRSYAPSADLQALGRSLSPDSPRILVFLGGTPELLQFTQGIDKQAVQRYVIAMSDVNLQTVTQMGFSRHAPVIATQVVPLVNTQLPLVRAYREALARYFDEPPTPHSLAGYIAARYTYEIMQGTDGALTPAGILQALRRRNSMDMGGFRIDLEAKRHNGSYVTQSMMTVDGRVIG